MEVFIKDDEFIVSKTDTKGVITYGNETFIKISGYKENELLHAPHSILRHPEMPKGVFTLLWQRIKAKKPINAFVKNKTKDGNFYWVFANVTASLNAQKELVGFYSVRRKPNQKGIKVIEEIYQQLLLAEKEGRDSVKLLENLLDEKGENYDEFIINLQQL